MLAAPPPLAPVDPRSRGGRRAAAPVAGHARAVFLFFSNRLGCLGSLLLSAALTLLIFFVFVR
jgi:hypothetical protein